MLKGKKRKKQSSKYNLSVITEFCSCFNTNFHKVESSCGTGQPYLSHKSYDYPFAPFTTQLSEAELAEDNFLS
jgi:hypothetical protein